MTKEDRKRILESAPVGTFALMSVVIGGMVVAWHFFITAYFCREARVSYANRTIKSKI